MRPRYRFIPGGARALAAALAFLAPALSGRADVIFSGNGAGAQASYVAGAGAGNLFQSWQQGSNPAVEGATSTVTYTRSG